MRIRIWHVVVFVVLLIGFALASAPAAFVASFAPPEFTYARAQGSVWNGRLEGVRTRGLQITTLSWRISPFDLLQGRVIAPLQLTGDVEGDMRLLANMEDRRLMADQLRINGLPLDNVMLAGTTEIEALDIFFVGGACRQATGTIRSDVLQQSSQALRINGPPLAGEARCDGEDALITLVGQNAGADQVNIVMRLRGDGGGEWRFAILSASPEVQAALAVAGFQPDAGTGQLVRNEELRWFPN